MGTKEDMLQLLSRNRGTYFSGEEIAKELGVSRTAVWKAARALRAGGYEIDAVQNRGYCLSGSRDLLTQQGVAQKLEPRWKNLDVTVLDTVTSTNALLRERACAGAPEGTVIIASSQTQGRGRLGRSFYSPEDTGVYLSLLLRPQGYSPVQSVRVTTMAAVAAAEALQAVSGRQAGIKWVNDIYMDGRKVCGILTEGAFNLELGSLDYVILGVGINVYPPSDGFPREIADIAGAVLPEPRDGGRDSIAAEFLSRFLAIWNEEGEGYADRYRSRSVVIGKEIRVIAPTGEREATALDVDNECRLIVRYADGTVESLSSAEISIRPTQGRFGGEP